MTGNGKLILLLSVILSVAFAEGNWWETGISIHLTKDNFDNYVGQDKHVFVDYFAQFCWHCMNMVPEWNILAEHYLGENPARNDIVIAKVDGGVELELANRYGVNAFPSFLFFKKGENFPNTRYTGWRTTDAFIQFIEATAGPEEKVFPPQIELADEIPEPQIAQEIQPQDAQNLQQSLDQIDNANIMDLRSEDISLELVVQKLDFLVDIVNRNNQNGGGLRANPQEKDLGELVTMMQEINAKFENNKASSQEDINFSHGVTFLLLGVFLGIGISFGMVNYQKLANSKRKLLD